MVPHAAFHFMLLEKMIRDAADAQRRAERHFLSSSFLRAIRPASPAQHMLRRSAPVESAERHAPTTEGQRIARRCVRPDA